MTRIATITLAILVSLFAGMAIGLWLPRPVRSVWSGEWVFV